MRRETVCLLGAPERREPSPVARRKEPVVPLEPGQRVPPVEENRVEHVI